MSDPLAGSAAEAARAQFAAAGLPAPPIPPLFAPRLLRVRDWLYSTRGDQQGTGAAAPGPYALQWYGRELLGGSVGEPYLLFGHDGHGINSWAMHWYMVRQPLAIFLQLPWGNAYDDDAQRAASAEALRLHFDAIERLLQATAGAANGVLGPDDWLIVVASDLEGSRAGLWPAGERTIEWHETDWSLHALERAAALLAGG